MAGHDLGSSGSTPGDSGAPVFYIGAPCELVGMVEGEDVPVKRMAGNQSVVAQQSRANIVNPNILMRRKRR